MTEEARAAPWWPLGIEQEKGKKMKLAKRTTNNSHCLEGYHLRPPPEKEG